jgi:hypothetical protein
MQEEGEVGFGGSVMPPQLSLRHLEHCGRALTPSQKFGVVVPLRLILQTLAQPPAESRSMQAHVWQLGSVVGVPLQSPLVVSQVSPARQSELLRQPAYVHAPLLQVSSAAQSESVVQPLVVPVSVPPPPAVPPVVLPQAEAATMPTSPHIAKVAFITQFIFIVSSLLDRGTLSQG